MKDEAKLNAAIDKGIAQVRLTVVKRELAKLAREAIDDRLEGNDPWPTFQKLAEIALAPFLATKK